MDPEPHSSPPERDDNPGSLSHTRPLVRGLAVGLALSLATVAVRWGLDRWLGPQVPLLWFVIPVLFAARTGGRAAGIVTAVFAGWLGTLLFVEPRGLFPLTDAGTLFWFTAFVAIGAVISSVAGSLRRELYRSQNALRVARGAMEALERETEARRDLERHWTQLVRMNLIATGVSDFEGAFHEANDALLELLGWTREELLAGEFRWLTLTPPEYLPLDEAAIRECRETGACAPYEKEYFTRDGRRVPVLLRFAMVAGSEDRVVLYVVDMTRQKKAEQALRENEARLRLVLDAVADHAIYSIGSDGRITSWNGGAQRVTGYTPEEAVGAPGSLLYPPDGDAEQSFRAHLRAARETGWTEEEGWRVRRDGSRFWASIVTAPLHGADGGDAGYVKIARDLTERRRAGVLMKSLLDNVADGILLLDEWGVILSFSQGAERMFGITEAQARGCSIGALLVEQDEIAYEKTLRDYLESGSPGPLGVAREAMARRPDGSRFPIEFVMGEFYLDGRRHFTGIVRDVTERRKLEAQLRQSQKMEAVGRLAGGVAHDFNNLLTVINGYSEMLLLEITHPEDVVDMVSSIGQAGEQAAGLTRQLLSFSRLAVLEPRVLNLNTIVGDTERILRRVIGEDVKLSTALAPDLWNVRVDAGQAGQIMMNLAINARDAMPQGGSLTIQTANITVDARMAGLKADLPEGRFVLLTIHDTGHGMSADVKSHLFEPFFTTKPPGHGTGLGLATVYGIVRGFGGHVDVYSELGVGTTFKIYLPAVIGAEAELLSGTREAPRGGHETILLVEDEERVREMATVALKGFGYRVIATAGGAEALALLADPAVHADLIVTDVIMPDMSGPEMAARAAALRPRLRCLFVSGYTDDTVVRHGILSAEMEFLQKPYTPRSLARKVREVLDRNAPDPRS